MTRRQWKLTPEAVANLTGLPLADVQDMMANETGFGPISTYDRHPWDARRVRIADGVYHDPGYSLAEEDDR